MSAKRTVRGNYGPSAICALGLMFFGYHLMQELNAPNGDSRMHAILVLMLSTLCIKYTLFAYWAYRYGRI